jgi:hypothetical protein
MGRQEHRLKPMLLSISRHRPSAQGAPLVGIEVWRVWPQVMTCLFRRFRCTCPISHLHSPRFHKPPYDPGRSVLPSPVLVSAWCAICWIMVFPSGRRLKHWFTYTPKIPRFTNILVPGSHTRTYPALCLDVRGRSGTTEYPEPLCPAWELPMSGMTSRVISEDITLPSSLIRAHASDQVPPTASFSLDDGSLQVVTSPCWELALPDVISAILV